MGPLKKIQCDNNLGSPIVCFHFKLNKFLSIFSYLTIIELLEDNGCKKLITRNLIFFKYTFWIHDPITIRTILLTMHVYLYSKKEGCEGPWKLTFCIFLETPKIKRHVKICYEIMAWFRYISDIFS